MYGICGTVGLDGYSAVYKMSKQMIHGGPDDFGIWRTFLSDSRLYDYSSILAMLSFVSWHEEYILR